MMFNPGDAVMEQVHGGGISDRLEAFYALVAERLTDDERGVLAAVTADVKQSELELAEQGEMKYFRELCEFQSRIAGAINSSRNISDFADKLATAGTDIENIDSGGVYICKDDSEVFEKIAEVSAAPGGELYNSFSLKFIREILHVNDGTVYLSSLDIEALGRDGFSCGKGLRSLAFIPIIYNENLLALLVYASVMLDDIPGTARAMLDTIGADVGSVFSRMAAEKALRLSEENYRLLVENQGDLVMKVDVQGRIIFANKVCCDFFNSSGDDVVGSLLLSFLEEDERRELVNKMRTLMKPPHSFYFDQESCAGNVRRWISWRCNAVLNQSTGEVSAFIGIGRDMTEHKKAEMLLRQSEERFRLVIKAVSDYIWDWDLEHNKLTFDDKLYVFLGYAVGEVELNIFDLIRNLVHIEDRGRVEKQIKDLTDGMNETFDCSYRIARKNGDYAWVLMRAVVVKNKQGVPVRMVGCLEDISERKNYDRIKEHYEFLQNILDALPLPVFYKDLQGRYLGYNRASLEFFNMMGADSSLGKTTHEVWNNIDFESCEQIVREESRLIQDGGHISYSMNLTPEHGEECDIVVHKSIVRNPLGIPEYIVGVLIDVTDMKKTENAFKLASQRLNTILNVMHEIIIWFDKDMKAVWGNRAAYSVLGTRHHGEIKGISCRELWYGSDEPGGELDLSEQALEEGHRSRKRRIINFEDGRIYETWFYPVHESGCERGWVQLTLDVSEQEKARKEAEIRQEQLIQADKMTSLGILVSGVAHEINNPNNFIVINVSILRKAWENIIELLNDYTEIKGEFSVAGVTYQKFRTMVGDLLAGIDEGAERIRVIVNDLKDYVRQTPTNLSGRFNVNDALSRSFTLCRNMLKRCTSNYKIIYGDDLPLVRGDVYRIEQVVINVVQNACQALKNSDDAVIVSTYAASGATREVVIEVIDEGVGISDEDLKHVTDPFFTTKRSIGGTGLGLSISNAIVEEHGGRLCIESTPGRGTCVKICLPYYDDAADSIKK
jgi:PAS domain S-box-containing protein